MPPSTTPPQPDLDRFAPPPQKSSAGPIVGVIIIVILMLFGALYFWGAHLNQEQNKGNNLPFIPGDTASTTEP